MSACRIAWSTSRDSSHRMLSSNSKSSAMRLSRTWEEAFWRGLQRYTKDHWNQPVVSADFQKSMESATGVNLSALFSKWVY